MTSLFSFYFYNTKIVHLNALLCFPKYHSAFSMKKLGNFFNKVQTNESIETFQATRFSGPHSSRGSASPDVWKVNPLEADDKPFGILSYGFHPGNCNSEFLLLSLKWLIISDPHINLIFWPLSL